jgi:hypothetical protein
MSSGGNPNAVRFGERKQFEGSRPIGIGMEKWRTSRRIVIDAGPGDRLVSGRVTYGADHMPCSHPAVRDTGCSEPDGVSGPAEGQEHAREQYGKGDCQP